MDAKSILKEIFGVAFEEQENITAVRQYRSPNTFCTNADGAIIAIHSSENTYTDLTITHALSRLQYLNLSDNRSLTSLVFECALLELWHFDSSDSAVEALKFPSGFENLKWLDASRNKLKVFALEGEMPQLTYLDISYNQIAALDIPDCPALAEIYAQNNQIQTFTITPKAQTLKRINLKKNKLENLPPELAELDSLHTLFLYENPLSDLPSAIVSDDEYGNSLEAVKNYLKELEKANIINNRAKLIIVGNGRVGKTSIRHRLAGEAFNTDEKYTHGIEFEKLNKENLPEVSTEELQLKIWDFGGQEIFYATHQFFLTEEAIYILAWTNEENVKPYREKEKGTLPFDEKWRECEYWLENIRLHGKKSPIIMVQTHRDIREHRLPVDPEWHERYQIESLTFSAKKDFGLDELKDSICEYLEDGESIPLFGKEFPLSYDNVIEAIEHRKKNENHITREQFLALCASVGIEKGSEHLLLDYLKKSGLVVYFDKPLLRDTVFINPNWLTEQVYKLINNELRPRNGQIDQVYLEQILPRHTPEMRAKFVALLQAFELIFQPKGEDYLVAPQYLPPNLEPNEQKFHDKLLRNLPLGFVFRFQKFLPDNVMINFLSRYGPYSDQIYWKDGISFTDKKEEDCIVHFNEKDQSLQVYANPSENGEALQREVCQSFIELSKNAYAEISIDGTHFVAWEKLQKQFELLTENPRQQILATDGTTALNVIDFSKFWEKGALLISHHEIDDLVRQSKLEEALVLLSSLVSQDGKEEVIQLQSRLSNLSNEINEGIIDMKDANLERNKISRAILSLGKEVGASKMRRK